MSQKRKRAGWSRAARSRLRSGQGSPRRRSHGGACDTLPTQRSSQLIKTFGTSSLLKHPLEKGAAVADQVRDRTPSNAWARKMPAPTRPIAAVNISNIAVVLVRPRACTPNAVQPCTVKNISLHLRTIDVDWGFGATEAPKRVPKRSGFWLQAWHESNDRLTNSSPTPFLPCSGCAIFSI